MYTTAGRAGCVGGGGLRQNLIVNALRTTGARRFRSWPTLCFVRLIIRQKGTYYYHRHRRRIATETPPPPRIRYALTTSQTDRTADGVQIFIIIHYYVINIIIVERPGKRGVDV